MGIKLLYNNYYIFYEVCDMLGDLKKFYQAVADDPALIRQFELIAERKDFIKLAIKLGAKKGYVFNASDIETSIEESTASGQGDYFCLPFGCWHKFKSAYGGSQMNEIQGQNAIAI
jgi:hypothetical protein